MNITEEQVLKLAPDAASEKAGKGLASPAKWVLRECSSEALWGHCQGSGKTPYQTQIDLRNVAFRCSCPSHKFPCKHGLGLLLLYASKPELFTITSEPEWVRTWLDKRAENAEKKELKEKDKAEKPVDEAARAKRQEARNTKVLSGVEELQMWMKDILRSGLLNIPERAGSLFTTFSRRMIDAQATGLAAMVARLAEINYYTDSWKYELTASLAKIYLLAESYKNLETLSPEWQEEVKSLVGFTQPKEEVLAGETVAGHWLAVYTESQQQEKLTVQYSWLYGRESKRFALFLQFIPPGAFPEFSLLPGRCIMGEVVYYKGVNPVRVLLKQHENTDKTFLPDACADVPQAVARYREAMTINPFTSQVPLLIDNVRLVIQSGNSFITDASLNAMPLSISDASKTKLLLITGGKPFSCFIFATEQAWSLKTLWIDKQYYVIGDE